MLSQLEGGEEQWVPDPPDLEERDILKVTYTGDDNFIPFFPKNQHILKICFKKIIMQINKKNN